MRVAHLQQANIITKQDSFSNRLTWGHLFFFLGEMLCHDGLISFSYRDVFDRNLF